jgi:hypothetical protein
MYDSGCRIQDSGFTGELAGMVFSPASYILNLASSEPSPQSPSPSAHRRNDRDFISIVKGMAKINIFGVNGKAEMIFPSFEP